MGQVKRGKMSQQQVDKLLTKLKGTLTYDEFKGVDMVVEAVIESIDLKQKIFAGTMASFVLGISLPQMEAMAFVHCMLTTFTCAFRSFLWHMC